MTMTDADLHETMLAIFDSAVADFTALQMAFESAEQEPGVSLRVGGMLHSHALSCLAGKAISAKTALKLRDEGEVLVHSDEMDVRLTRTQGTLLYLHDRARTILGGATPEMQALGLIARMNVRTVAAAARGLH